MSAGTPENKAVEAMAFAMANHVAIRSKEEFEQFCRDRPIEYQQFASALQVALLALAETITDEMAERGGRRLYESDPLSGLDPDNPETFWRASGPAGLWDQWCGTASTCFAEMCRAAAGTDREGG